MAKRLILRSDGELSLADLDKFVQEAYKRGKKRTANIEWDFGDDIIISIPLSEFSSPAPTKKVVEEESKPVKKRSVKKTGKSRDDKVRCSVCAHLKPVVKQGSIYVVKPHVVKGDPCSGGGAQVVKSKNGRASEWRVVTEEG